MSGWRVWLPMKATRTSRAFAPTASTALSRSRTISESKPGNLCHRLSTHLVVQRGFANVGQDGILRRIGNPPGSPVENRRAEQRNEDLVIPPADPGAPSESEASE